MMPRSRRTRAGEPRPPLVSALLLDAHAVTLQTYRSQNRALIRVVCCNSLLLHDDSTKGVHRQPRSMGQVRQTSGRRSISIRETRRGSGTGDERAAFRSMYGGHGDLLLRTTPPGVLGRTRRPSGDRELRDGALALKKWVAGLRALHLGDLQQGWIVCWGRGNAPT